MKIQYTLIENDHLGDWSPAKDCFWQLKFRHPVRKLSPESSLMLLLGSNHFLKMSLLYCRPALPMVRFGSIRISGNDDGAGDDINENIKLFRSCSRSGN